MLAVWRFMDTLQALKTHSAHVQSLEQGLMSRVSCRGAYPPGVLIPLLC